MSHRKEIKMNDGRQQVTARFFEENLPSQVKLMTYDELERRTKQLRKRHKDQAALDAAVEAMLIKERSELRDELLVKAVEQAAKQQRVIEEQAAKDATSKRVTIQEAIDAFKQQARVDGLSLATYRKRKYMLKRMFQLAGGNEIIPLRDMTSDIPEDFLVRCITSLRETGFEQGSVHTYAVVMKSFLNFIKAEGMTTVTFKEQKLPKRPACISKALTVDEVERLVRAAEEGSPVLGSTHFRQKQAARAIILLRYTGMRLNELFNLKLSDFYIDGRDRMPFPHVLVGSTVATKTGLRSNSRQVSDKGTVRSIAAERCLDFLRKDFAMRNKNEVWFLDNGCGSRFYAQKTSLTRMMKSVMTEMGIDDVQPCHAFRHTAAIELHEAGADLPTIQHYLGHSNPQTTAQRYLNTERVQRTLGNAAQLLK